MFIVKTVDFIERMGTKSLVAKLRRYFEFIGEIMIILYFVQSLIDCSIE